MLNPKIKKVSDGYDILSGLGLFIDDVLTVGFVLVNNSWEKKTPQTIVVIYITTVINPPR